MPKGSSFNTIHIKAAFSQEYQGLGTTTDSLPKRPYTEQAIQSRHRTRPVHARYSEEASRHYFYSLSLTSSRRTTPMTSRVPPFAVLYTVYTPCIENKGITTSSPGIKAWSWNGCAGEQCSVSPGIGFATNTSQSELVRARDP